MKRDPILAALGALCAIAVLGLLALIFEPAVIDPEDAHPVAYQACLDRGECR